MSARRPCDACGGTGEDYKRPDLATFDYFHDCPACSGRGWQSDAMPVSDALADAAQWWTWLADEEADRLTWDRTHHPKTVMAICDTYLRTAEVLRREASTGKPHCSTCGGEHANHQHPSIAVECGCRCGATSCLWCSPAAAIFRAVPGLREEMSK